MLRVYRNLLRLSRKFEDPVVRDHVRWRTRREFRRNRNYKVKEREIENTKASLKTVRRAVEGKSADCEEVVREAYGLRGQAKINTQRFLYERFVSGSDDSAARVVDISPFLKRLLWQQKDSVQRDISPDSKLKSLRVVTLSYPNSVLKHVVSFCKSRDRSTRRLYSRVFPAVEDELSATSSVLREK